MNSAIGMVLATAKVPHGLPLSAFTTTRASTAEQDHANEGDANSDDAAGGRTDLGADHLAERLGVAAGREEQHDHVLDRPGEHDAGQNPQGSGQVAHLRRKHRPDQRPRAGDRREMMAVEDVAVGRDVIEPVVVAIGGRHALRIDAERARDDEQRIEAVGDEVDADRGGHEPRRVDRFAARERHDGEGGGAQESHPDPGQLLAQFHKSPPAPSPDFLSAPAFRQARISSRHLAPHAGKR